jgi:hypothetical protein
LKHAHVFAHPGDPKYWYRNTDYHRSLKRPLDPQPLRFRTTPTEAPLPADASAESGIYAASETLRDHGTSVTPKLTLVWPGAPGVAPAKKTIANLANEEAATFIVVEAMPGITAGSPVRTIEEFAALASWADQQPDEGEPIRVFRHRHAWSVIGGVFNHKGRAFVGYFQLCLEESGF